MITLEGALHCVGKGWAPLLKALYAVKPPEVKVLQIKEKFAALRFYTDGGPEWFLTLINACESYSYHRCEWCGSGVSPEQWEETNKDQYWMKTLCAACCEKRKAGWNPWDAEHTSGTKTSQEKSGTSSE
jgi:hypothetical protein